RPCLGTAGTARRPPSRAARSRKNGVPLTLEGMRTRPKSRRKSTAQRRTRGGRARAPLARNQVGSRSGGSPSAEQTKMPTKVPTKSKPKHRPTAKVKHKHGAKADKMPAEKLPKGRPSGGSRSKSKVVLRHPAPPLFIPRAVPAIDDDDVLMAHGAGGGVGYGRCGGRLLGSKLEQTICDRLGQAGVAHSHSPRHFEVRLDTEKGSGQVAAYAPMVVL